ncbi:hypothetical protein Tco_0205730 [Tanacetum coccineum]
MEKRHMMVSNFMINCRVSNEYEIRYHQEGTSATLDVTEAMAMTIQYRVTGIILAAQSEALKQDNALAERLHHPQADGQSNDEFILWEDNNEGMRLSIDKIGESGLTGPEFSLKIRQIGSIDKRKSSKRQDIVKRDNDNRRKLLEFEVGDRVMLKVSSWKGVVHFGKKGKLGTE